MNHTTRSVSLVILLLAAGVATAATLLPVVADSVHAFTDTGPPDARAAAMLVLLSAAGAALTWAWLLLCVLACLHDLRSDGCIRWRLGAVTTLRPERANRIVRRLVGAAAVPATLMPVVTGPTGPVRTAVQAVSVTQEEPALPGSLSGLLLPDRVTGTVRIPERYRVRGGDTLWGIAADQLPPGSPDVVVDRSWRRLFAVNRAAVGSDPHLIKPGTLLRLPRGTGPSS